MDKKADVHGDMGVEVREYNEEQIASQIENTILSLSNSIDRLETSTVSKVKQLIWKDISLKRKVDAR